MKISKESVDKQKYIDILLSDKEVSLLKEYIVISAECYINGEPISIGIMRDTINEKIVWEGGF